jgi:menaquinone-dependent protoporphyrinogen oxidase
VTVLVAFGSRTGSTGRVAVEIATRLAEHGLAVDVRPLSESGPRPDLRKYDHVVLGSALYSGGWLPDAVTFAQRNGLVLADRNVWTFTVGRRCDSGRRRAGKAWDDARELAEIHRVVQPRSHHFFPAISDVSELSRRQRVRLRSQGGGYGDLRKRPEVNAWANTIARQLLVGSWQSEPMPALAS